MKIKLYILMVQDFFRDGGVDYAAAMREDDIRPFFSIDECFDYLSELENKARAKGWRVVDSSSGTEKDEYAYKARWETGATTACVFTILSRDVEGEPFTFG